MNLYKYHTRPEKLELHDKAPEKVPAVIWDKYEDQPDELEKREKILAKDPLYAYLYAVNVLQDRFPAGEAAIAKSAEHAYGYALIILRAAFPKGEAAIATSGLHAQQYARFVIKKPFPKGEAAIANHPNPDVPYWYARDTLDLSHEEAKAWGKTQLLFFFDIYYEKLPTFHKYSMKEKGDLQHGYFI